MMHMIEYKVIKMRMRIWSESSSRLRVLQQLVDLHPGFFQHLQPTLVQTACDGQHRDAASEETPR